MNQSVPKAPKKSGRKRRLAIRALAFLLVVVLLAGTVLYQKTDILLNADLIENKGARVAAIQLLGQSGYTTAPRLRRMTDYARWLISGEHSFEDYELAAQIAVSQGQYVDAIAFTEKARELYQGDEAGLAGLYLRLGYLYTLEADYPSAVQWLDRGLAIVSLPEALLTRAQVKLNMNDTPGAMADVTAYLKTTQDALPMLPNLINVYEAVGEYETAAQLYTRLIDASGDADYLLNRAYCYTNLNRMEEAAADIARYASEGGGEVGAANVMLGIGWMRNGEHTKANDCFVQAINEQYSDPESLYYYVVLCAYATKDYARACEYGDALIDRVLSGGGAETASVGMESATGKLNVTLAQIDKASLCLMTGASHVWMGNYEDAEARLTACLEQDANAAYANYLRGTCLLAAEKFAEAIPDFDEAIAADTETEKSHYGRGVCRMQLGDIQGAMDDFDWVMLNGENEELFKESSQLIVQLMLEDSAGSEAETDSRGEAGLE